jgi:hypothetical protein
MRASVARVIAGTYLFSVLLFGLLIRRYDWSQIERALAHGPPCPLRRWTGLLCSFCGMTHSWIAIAKGDWGRATHENALGIPFFAATIVLAGTMLMRRKPVPVPRQATATALIVLVTYAVVRNLA